MGWLRLDLLNIYLQEGSCIINKAFQMLLDNKEIQIEVVLSINIHRSTKEEELIIE